jgi:hypothetical protein
VNDLDLMRNFCAEEAPPSLERLAALRARVVTGFGGAPRGWQRARGTRWRAAPGPARLALTGVAAAVLAGVVAAAVIVPGAGARQGAGAVQLTAATVLQRAARAALTAPSPGTNQFIYIDTLNTEPHVTPKHWAIREWVSIHKGYQGIVQWTSCGTTIGAAFRHDPGCWMSIAALDGLPLTYTELERLPTSARALLGYLNREQYRACGPASKRMNQAELEWSGIVTILEDVPVLPPRFGAALFDAAAQVPGVRVIRNVRTAAGQPGIAVARTVPKGDAFFARQVELIFSSRTYRYIGNVLGGSATHQTPQSSAVIMSGFTSTYPHHSRPDYGYSVLPCIALPGS